MLSQKSFLIRHLPKNSTPQPRIISFLTNTANVVSFLLHDSIPEQIEVPNFTSIDQGEEFLNDISVRLGRGEIDSQSALELG